MPAITFPSNPTNGQEFTANDRTWTFDSSVPAWRPKLDPAVPPDLGSTYVAHNIVQALSELQKRRAQSNIGLPKLNLEATDAPGVTNGSNEGYGVLSIWADVTNDKAYLCVDPSPTAAVWLPLGLTPQEVADLIELTITLTDIDTTGEDPGNFVLTKDGGGLESLTAADTREVLMPVLLRPAADGPPNGTTAQAWGSQVSDGLGVTVSNAGVEAVNGLWLVVGALNGKSDYRKVDNAVSGAIFSDSNPMTTGSYPRMTWIGGQWRIYADGGVIHYTSDSDTPTPELATWTAVVPGTAVPTFGEFPNGETFQVTSRLVGSYIGQICRWGDLPGPFEWFFYNGQGWAPITHHRVAGYVDMYHPDVSISLNNGNIQKLSLYTDVTIYAPFGIGASYEGAELLLWVRPVLADRQITLAGVLLPTESNLTWPKTLTQNRRYLLKFIRSDAQWYLVSFVGGY